MSSPPALPGQKAGGIAFRWRPLDKGELDYELLWLGITVSAALFAVVWMKAGLPHPQCTFHAWTGYPCVSCGCTRAALRLLQGDLAGAVALNPLFVALLAVVVVIDTYAAAVLLSRGPRLRLVRISPLTARTLRWTAGVVIALNWVWLIYRGV